MRVWSFEAQNLNVTGLPIIIDNDFVLVFSKRQHKQQQSGVSATQKKTF